MRYTVCVDFDGTIVDHAFPEIGKLKPGVKDALARIIEHYDIVVSSCRGSALFRKAKPKQAIPDQHPADGRDYLQEMEAFLKREGVPYTRIDRGDEGKVVAVAYIDDRGIKYADGPKSWEVIADYLIPMVRHE